MELSEYLRHDGIALSGLIREGEVTPRELLSTALEQLDRVNPVLNAVVHRMDEEARRIAGEQELLALEARGRSGDDGTREDDQPFLGVPFLVKDLLTFVAGHPHTRGSRLLRDWVPQRDAEMVRRFRRAGFLLLGKTNTPEFGLVPFTEPELFGPCRNPWDPERTPGGSSGGSAAAVAGGVVPLAGASDGAGSIRIPASCCGLFGLKPSRGRVPSGPDQGRNLRGFTQDHVVSRSVRDSAAALDATAGPEAGAPFRVPPPERPYVSEVGRDPGRLRIALTTLPLLGTEVDPVCIEAAHDAGRLLEELGHYVEEATPPVDRGAFCNAFVVMTCGEIRADVKDAERLTGRVATPRDLEPESWALNLLGERISGGTYASALRTLEDAAFRIGPFFEEYDLLLTPTLARLPVPLGSLRPAPVERRALELLGRLRVGRLFELLGIIDRAAEDAFAFTPYTPLFNATGQPCMSVPLHWTGDSMPVGVHLVGRFGAEDVLFRVAGQLEAARPWFSRLPDWIREPGTRPAPRPSRTSPR